jgi:hypothetical protein
MLKKINGQQQQRLQQARNAGQKSLVSQSTPLDYFPIPAPAKVTNSAVKMAPGGVICQTFNQARQLLSIPLQRGAFQDMLLSPSH